MRDLEAGLLGEFDASAPMMAAAEALRRSGFTRVVAFTPYDVPGLADTLGLGRTRLPRITLIAGLCGAVFAYWLQWYTNASAWPLNVGSRPPHAAPAFILITFETTVLFAACVGFVALFALVGLPRLWHPVSSIDGFERATVDRFWIGVSRTDPAFDPDRIVALLEAQHPVRIVNLEAGR